MGGNSFDFVSPGPEYDQVVADGTWHEALLSNAPDDIDFISLHSLPMNDHLLADVPDEEAHLAILGQVVTWERRFLPDLLNRCADVPRSSGRGPIRLAVTEWGPLGAHPTRLMAENFGAAIYAATFLAMLIRNAERIPIASPNGFMHGGCIRKVGGRIFLDPQVTVQAAFRQFIGWEPAACNVTGPGYDIDHPADIGARDRDVPIVDAIVCRDQAGDDIRAALVNRHPTRPMSVEMRVAGYDWPTGATIETLVDSELSARATPAEPDRFARQVQQLDAEHGALVISLPPASVVWVRS